MWPWGHLAVGYLCYVAVTRARDGSEQMPLALVALAVGSQFPDLIDKPLAWSLAVLPSGRSLAHSLLVAAVVLGVAYRMVRRRSREEVVAAFGVGWVAHSLADLGPEVVSGLLRGDLEQLTWTTYLLWPVLPSPPYPMDSSFAEHFAAFAFEPYVLAQFGLLGVATAVWMWTGAVGVGVVREGVEERLKRGA